MNRHLSPILLGLLVTATCVQGEPPTAQQACNRLGRGINLGNMLEAPREGEWGVRFEDSYAKLIKKAGFSHVRLPVKWSAHAEASAPYTLDPSFLSRVRHILDTCLAEGLLVILDLHHYDEIHAEPQGHAERLVGLWKQIAEATKGLPPQVYFELLNEPHGKLDTDQWNELFPKALAVVRPLHPHRPVIVGPGGWNNHTELPNLRLPADDQYLIATFHYYSPFPFTHQGAEWEGDRAPPVGREFPQSDQELTDLRGHFQGVADWARTQQRPMYLGEFGAYHKASMESRVRWTQEVRSQAEKHGFAWAYWEFCAGFGVYDPAAQAWREPLLEALRSKD